MRLRGCYQPVALVHCSRQLDLPEDTVLGCYCVRTAGPALPCPAPCSSAVCTRMCSAQCGKATCTCRPLAVPPTRLVLSCPVLFPCLVSSRLVLFTLHSRLGAQPARARISSLGFLHRPHPPARPPARQTPSQPYSPPDLDASSPPSSHHMASSKHALHGPPSTSQKA